MRAIPLYPAANDTAPIMGPEAWSLKTPRFPIVKEVGVRRQLKTVGYIGDGCTMCKRSEKRELPGVQKPRFVRGSDPTAAKLLCVFSYNDYGITVDRVVEYIRSFHAGHILLDLPIRCGVGNVTDVQLGKCRPYLTKSFQEFKPDRVICFGGRASSAVLGVSVPAWANRWCWTTIPGWEPDRRIPIVVTMDPTNIARSKFHREVIEDEIRWAITGTFRNTHPRGNALVVESEDDIPLIHEWVEKARWDTGWVAHDVETDGVMFNKDFSIIAGAFSSPTNPDVLVWDAAALANPVLLAECVRILTDPLLGKKGSNFKYDTNSWLAWKGVVVYPFVGDSRLEMKQANPDSRADLESMGFYVGINAHKTEAKEYIKVAKKLAKEELDPDIEGVSAYAYVYKHLPPDVMLRYNALDTMVTGMVCDYSRRSLGVLENTFNRLILPASEMYAAVEETGFAVDLSNISTSKAYLEGDIAKLMPRFEKAGIDPDKPDSIRQWLERMDIRSPIETATGLASTSAKALGLIQKAGIIQYQNELIADVLNYRKLAKLLHSYADTLPGYVRADGRVHPSFLLDGARSGRVSCIAGDQRMWTNHGWVRFDELGELLTRTSVYTITHNDRWCRVTACWKTGIRPTVKVRLADGKAIHCTPDHKLRSGKKWVQACDTLGRRVQVAGPSKMGKVKREGYRIFTVGRNMARRSAGVVPRLRWKIVARASMDCSWGSSGGGGRYSSQDVGAARPRPNSDRAFYFSRLPGSPNNCAQRSHKTAESRRRYSEVVAVEESLSLPVYDFTVDVDHSGCVEGCLVKNCRNPALQTIPSRGDLAKLIKNCFVARPGYRLVCADFNILEIKVAAILSGDPEMLAAALGDFHTETAKALSQLAWGVAAEVVEAEIKSGKKTKRDVMKVVGFSVLYGAGSESIAEKVGCSVKEADKIVGGFFKRYSRLAAWMREQLQFARENGMVEIPWLDGTLGRIRPLLDILNADPEKRGNAARATGNCLDAETEALTQRGWVKGFDLDPATDKLLTKNANTGRLEWAPITELKLFPDYDGEVVEYKSRSFHAVSTPKHRWLVYNANTDVNECRTTETLATNGTHRIHRTGNYESNAVFSDNFVELCGWFLTDGSRQNPNRGRPSIYLFQSERANPAKVARIDSALAGSGLTYSRAVRASECVNWHIYAESSVKILDELPNRVLTHSFLSKLSGAQAKLLVEVMMLGDGTRDPKTGKAVFSCRDQERSDMFQALATLAGVATTARTRDMRVYGPRGSTKLINKPMATQLVYNVTLLARDKVQVVKSQVTKRIGPCPVWCPVVPNTYFVARRSGTVYITGNTPIQSLASDICMSSAVRIHDHYKKKRIPARIVCLVHDSIISEVRDDYVMEVAKAKKHFMTNWKTGGVPLTVEIEQGVAWGSQTRIEI